MEGLRGFAKARHTIAECGKIMCSLGCRDNPGGHIVSHGGDDFPGSALARNVACREHKILHLGGFAHARYDASGLVQQNKCPSAAPIGDGLYEKLKRFVSLGASLVATVVHPSDHAIENEKGPSSR
jgi:hypothetical protein